MKPALGVILLAAGESARLGQAKQLVDLGGISLVRHAAEMVLGLEPAYCVVITGAGAAAVTGELQGLPLRCEYNTFWKAGMSASIACGARALPGNLDGVLIYLCDQWRITRDDIHNLYKEWLCDTGAIVSSTWNGVTGPPVIFPAPCLDQLRTLTGDKGARSVIREQSQTPVTVSMDNARHDLDTPADMEQLGAFLSNEKISTPGS